MQDTTSHLMRKQNEVRVSENAEYNKVIGSARRRNGYEKVGETIQYGNDSLYGGVFRYGDNHKLITGINSSSGLTAGLRYLDTGGYWTSLLSDAAPHTRFNCLNYFDELYVCGMSPTNVYYPLTNIDASLTTSLTRNVQFAPKCRFIVEFGGRLLALNCEVNGVRRPNFGYFSSPPIGAITFVQTEQKGLLKQLRVDSVRYLKPGMIVDIYGAGTEAKKVSSLTIISVDKKNNRISFADTQIDVADNDEIWPEGRKGKLTVLWNTDYPTPQSADSFFLPPGLDVDNAITGWGKNNGRLLLFTKNSVVKYDGASLVPVSETVGCVSHETIKNVGSWTIWAHSSGVWGYNDNIGQPKKLSKAVQKYFAAINQSSYPKMSANVNGANVYKLAVGELLPVDSPTTSTSTSSTSTSSTSSSTSSTSTSSTSTSSTSTSQTTTTTSTSSTSSSTSSTSTSSTSVSTSSTSTSTSTSTSSTTTTTLASSKRVVRFCYDFDSNTWWLEYHRREIRFQFNHTMHGYTKPYFTDENGMLFRDETGNLDHEDTIPMAIEWGRDNFGTELKKHYHGCTVDAELAAGTMVMAAIDGSEFKPVGQITQTVTEFTFPFTADGHDVNYKFTHNDQGDSPVINGVVTYWSPAESQGASG